ncbi:MAG TPA: DeoR/GlpR transcriptional regulator [Firmicutes bacterium]|nr:DeoR/GlpR transcriptional regulator [Bacillota bacterium]
MLAAERRTLILAQVEQSGSVKVRELSRFFQVTEETIRRDLEELEKQGQLQRTYGGAIKNHGTGYDPSFARRINTNLAEKQQIARMVKSLIKPGDTLALDASTTALVAARTFSNHLPLTILTNSIQAALELAAKPEINVICTGGTVRESSLSFVGPLAQKVVSEHFYDKAIISAKGLSLEHGMTESNHLEAELKKCMIKSAKEVIFVADHSKFGYVGFARVCALDDIDVIVTDHLLDPEVQQQLKEAGVELIVAPPE